MSEQVSRRVKDLTLLESHHAVSVFGKALIEILIRIGAVPETSRSMTGNEILDTAENWIDMHDSKAH